MVVTLDIDENGNAVLEDTQDPNYLPPLTITIPAGETSASIYLNVSRDDLEDDDLTTDRYIEDDSISASIVSAVENAVEGSVDSLEKN